MNACACPYHTREYLCPYCGEPVTPLNYHEGKEDCEAAAKRKEENERQERPDSNGP